MFAMEYQHIENRCFRSVSVDPAISRFRTSGVGGDTGKLDFMHLSVRLTLACLLGPLLLVRISDRLTLHGQSLPDHPKPQQSLPDAPSAVVRLPEHPNARAVPRANSTRHVDAPWPREAVRADEKISMYPPQLETWRDEELHAYAALSIERKDGHKPNYGVIWFTAQTEVDKVNRQVTLDNFKITKVSFPTLQAEEAEYWNFLQAKLPGKSKVIALDRLEAALAVSTTGQDQIKGVPVSNDPPRVIFTTKPSLLVLIDGGPRFRDVGGTAFQKVLNTQAFILVDRKTGKYYLNVMDGWLDAPALEGPWSYTSKIPDDMKEITKGIQERQLAKATEGSTPPSLQKAKKEGKIPIIYVNQGPAELLATDGPPQWEPLTHLEYVKNTSANIFKDPTTSEYYILLAGRWFRSKSLEGGPWEFINAKDLPEVFTKIPEDSPKAGVLASIPGTPPAQEAFNR